jgi:hypothetical protein
MHQIDNKKEEGNSNMAAILFYRPFSFYHADMLVNIAGVSENELQGLKKTTVFNDTNNVGTLSGRHFTLRWTTLCCYLLLFQ